MESLCDHKFVKQPAETQERQRNTHSYREVRGIVHPGQVTWSTQREPSAMENMQTAD